MGVACWLPPQVERFLVSTRNIILANQATVQLHNTEIVQFPNYIHSHYREIAFEDVREGMEDLWYETKVVVTDEGRMGNSCGMTQIGTVTGVAIDSDGDLRVKTMLGGKKNSHLITKTRRADAYTSYNVILQRYVWRKLTALQLTAMHGNDIDKRIFQSHVDQVGSYVTRTYDFQEHGHRNPIGNTNWQTLLTTVNQLPETHFAVYELVPSPIKILRKPEDIPPMPGEKPIQPQPGAGDAPAPTPAEGYDDNIPAMPGASGVNVTLPNKTKDDSGPLNNHWWGTENGD